MKRDNGGYQLWGKSHNPTAADEYQQSRLPEMPSGEMGGRRLLPGLEIARPYNTTETPLFASIQDAGYLLAEYGECGDLVEEVD